MIDRARLGGLCGLALGLGAALSAGGCARPVENTPQPGAHITGQFPNLNIPPKSAATQLSADQTKADTSTLQTAGQANATQAAVPADLSDPEELRKLGATHAADTLKQIEK